VATPAWLVLLVIGAWMLIRGRDYPRLRIAVGVTLLYELLLHLLYGRETFLYAMHYVPLFFVAIALACHTRLRPLVLALASVLAVTNGMNSLNQFSWARAYAHRYRVINSQQDEIKRRVHYVRPETDPMWEYRFIRDVWNERKASR
jgi:hypothetical protein